MGCSVSKDLVESPSKDIKEAWEAVLSKRLTLQLDTHIKPINAGYIAAIFSTKLRHTGPVEAFDRNDLFLSQQLPYHEDYPMKKKNKSVRRAMKKGSPDMALVQPLLNSGKAKETSTSRKWKEGAKAELETIDTWELMKDLEEEDSSKKRSHDNTPQPATTLSKSKSLTSFRCADDVDASIAMRTNIVSVMEESAFCISLHDVEEVKELSDLGSHKLSGMAHQGDILPEDSSSCLVCRCTCEDGSYREPLRMNEKSAWTPHDLQRDLSMKYILSDNARENEESDFPDVSQATSHRLSEVNAAVFEEHNPDFPMASDGSSTSSSPEFSATASLKDWLPSDSPPPFSLSDSLHDGVDASVVFEGIQTTHILLEQHMNPYLLPNTRCDVLSKYVGGGADFSLQRASEQGLRFHTEAHMEECGIHAFNMELGGIFDKAKEECCVSQLLGSSFEQPSKPTSRDEALHKLEGYYDRHYHEA